MRQEINHITPDAIQAQPVQSSANSPASGNEYRTAEYIAKKYHIAVKTLRNWCSKHEINGLPYLKLGRVPLFPEAEFDLWIRMANGSKAMKEKAVKAMVSLQKGSRGRPLRIA